MIKKSRKSKRIEIKLKELLKKEFDCIPNLFEPYSAHD